MNVSLQSMKIGNCYLSLLSGLLLSAAWPVIGFAPLLFIGLVPLLIMENRFFERNELRAGKIFWLSYLAFFTWNLLTTWWVYNASLGGAAMAIIFNSLFMAVIFMLYHVARNRIGFGYTVLISLWIAFEYIHMQWDITWPWLTLGNGFASFTKWIQWYEYTGVFGGSLWIITVNYLVFMACIHWKKKAERIKFLGFSAAAIGIPVVWSLIIYSAYEEKADPVNIVVVQPNIDPYNEKFNGMTAEAQLSKMLNLAAEKIDTATDYVVFPETALTENIWEDQVQESFSYNMLKAFTANIPHVTLVTGLSSNKAYPTKQTPTARQFFRENMFYDSYNTAMQMNGSGEFQLYHKSKLVPGVEKMPFPTLFKPLEALAIDLGGTTGSLGIQEERTVFFSDDKTGIAPVICYESIYGEYVSDYVKNGAELIFIITNDGWWGDTPGYRQHLDYGRLRAIESRRSIARSANTGISALIDQRGDVITKTDWWVPASFSGSINKNAEQTFYTAHGDYIARALSFFALIIIITTIYKSIIRKAVVVQESR